MNTIAPQTPSASPSHPRLRHWLDCLLTRPMVLLALVYLLVLAGVTHRLHSHIAFIEAELILGGLWLLLPVFAFVSLLRAWLCHAPGFWRRLGTFLLYSLPPVHLCGRSFADPSLAWLPGLGWRHVDRELRKRLERAFSVPMIIIALMVLPFLAMEYHWGEEVRADFGLALFLDIGTGVIWTAFAIEFIIMLSVAEKKASYCLKNWTDVAVVLLPLVEFLPFLRLLRLSRLLQLQQLGRMGRMYRLRGLALKLWRALLVLEVMQRLTGYTPEKRLKRLRELLTAKEEEIADLRKEIAEIEKQVPLPATTQPAVEA